MYSVIEDFVWGWEYEIEATTKIFKTIPDELLVKKIEGYDRTLAFLAWHITTSISLLGLKAGLNVFELSPYSEPPNNSALLASEYRKVSENLLKEVKEKWNNESLLELQDIFGEKWMNGKTLAVIAGHQTHHRGQMTALMRILGIKVPGVYGPSKEEWVQLGMESQK